MASAAGKPAMANIWKAAAAEAAAPAVAAKKKNKWIRGKRTQTKHMTVAPRFGSVMSYFRVTGSAIFAKPVVLRSLLAGVCGTGAYYANKIDPERGITEISPFYFTVVGTCLSFLLVFKSNIAYSRFWEARGHAGIICHGLRNLVRDLVFSTNVGAGRDTPAVYAVQRYCNAFFALLLQDVRMSQDLAGVPPSLLTESEKAELLSVRCRRPPVCPPALDLPEAPRLAPSARPAFGRAPPKPSPAAPEA